MGKLDIIIHEQIQSLESMMPEWTNLKEDFHNITVFQDIDWIKNWWEYKLLKQDMIKPYIIEIKEKEKIIGIIPLYCSLHNFAGLNFRVLKPIGSELSDYLIPIVSKKYSIQKILDMVMKKLNEHRTSWDYIEWSDIPAKSAFDCFFNDYYINNSSLIKRKQTFTCPFLKFDNSFNETQQNFGKRHIKEVLYKERRLSRNGNLRFEKVNNKKEIEPILSKLFEFHYDRWKSTLTPSRYRLAEERDFIIQTAKDFYDKDLLELSYLSFNNEIIAAEFGMTDGKRRYLYLHGINPKYKKHSIGHILAYHLIKMAYEDEHEIMDFLRGNQSYKKQWGTSDEYNIKYIIYNESLKSNLFKMIKNTYYSQQFYKETIFKQFLIKTFIRTCTFAISIFENLKPKTIKVKSM